MIPRSRGRSCSAPPPSHGGPECGGESAQQQQCRPAAECHAPGPSVQVSRGDIVPVLGIYSPLQVPDLTSRCGVRPPGSTQWRVVGGVAAKLHSHPWLAALGYRSKDEVHCNICNRRSCPNVQQ